MTSSINISMKPLCILVYAGAWLALRMTRKIGSFRTGEVLRLVMPFQTSVASAVNENKSHFTLTLPSPVEGEGNFLYFTHSPALSLIGRGSKKSLSICF
jgi:hypothetical protein